MNFMTRALRAEARSGSSHAIRALCAFVVYGVCTGSQFNSRGAPGLDLFAHIAILTCVAILFGGYAFFKSFVSEERKSGGFALLVLTGIGFDWLLAGKLVPRFVAALLTLLVQMPFTLLCVTLGGVTPHQIFAAYAALLALLVLVSGLGALGSIAILRSVSFGCLLAPLVVAFMALAVFPFDVFSANSGTQTLLEEVVASLSQLSPIQRMRTITTTGFNEPIVSLQVIAHTLGGIGFFALGRSILPGCIDLPSPDALPSDARAERSSQRRRSNRAWPDPILWKEYYLGLGGPTGSIGLLIFVPPAALVIAMLLAWGWPSAEDFGNVLAVVAVILLGLQGLATGMSISTEIQQKTLASLILLPIPTIRIVRSFLAAWSLAAVPFVLLLIASALFSASAAQVVGPLATTLEGWITIACGILAVHLVMVFSLESAVGCLLMLGTIFLLYLVIAITGEFRILWSSPVLVAVLLLPAFVIAVLFLQYMIAHLVREAAERE